MQNCWNKHHNTNKPFFVLAPMEDVTDMVFRQIVKKANNGKPEIVVTEFTNCDGICSVGQSRIIHRLKYNPDTERPIIAQIWGKTPENYYQTAKLCLELGFDGVDINMGCPEKNVIRQGACSALIRNQDLAKQIIEAVQNGVENKIPVSVKTRIGFFTIQTEEWFSFLLEQNLQAITVHGRTVKGSDEPANWEEIGKVVRLKNQRQATQLEEKKQNWISSLSEMVII
jgi:tRNA-dihydrouridine synthase